MATVLADPALYAFTGGEPPQPDALRARYRRMTAGSPDPTILWRNWVISLRDQPGLLGTVQATIENTGAPIAEIAWIIGSPWQRRGIATEAAIGLVEWLGRQGVSAIIAHIHPDHVASIAVARAAGLVPTDEWHDGEVRYRSG